MEDWEKLLDPKVLRGSLLTSSIYIAAYEVCRESTIDKLRGYYFDHWDKDGPHSSDDYKSKVLSLDKSPLQATLLWLKDRGAIDDGDIEAFSKARQLRNQVAHDLPKFLSSPVHKISQEVFDGLLNVTHKIVVWWVVNVEIATDPDYDGAEIDESGIKIGTILMIQMMMDIAYGNEPEEGYFNNAVKSAKGS